jgi:hypothetical protein
MITVQYRSPYYHWSFALLELKIKPKSRAADNAALRARRKKAGLVSYREYVTPEEKVRLVVCLDNLRGITTEEL